MAFRETDHSVGYAAYILYPDASQPTVYTPTFSTVDQAMDAACQDIPALQSIVFVARVTTSHVREVV